ncbi:MAG TPA: immunoglobulin domain-containing protein, partial [Candidatus Acidoferrales bacterium]|nr:immunoglobulin domain-containing protein [Candidatus Acidoferrales bacterium]
MIAGCSSGPGTGTTKNVAPTITTQPASVSVTAGKTAVFAVVASGTQPLSYQWQKNQQNISGATSASYTTPATTTADNGATFRVIVSNGTAPDATSTAASLTVTAAPVAPTITTQPQNATVTVGQTATFTVVAAGTAPLNYQWQKNQQNISGATNASYTTPATTTADNGATFRVIVTNGTAPDATSADATLTVNPVQTSTVNVLTYHNDYARTGQNLNETILTTANVNSTTFGKLATLPVSGNVDAEPLYVSNLTVNGAVHNVLFVVTEQDMAYAFDADTFAQLWSKSVANGESFTGTVDSCGQVSPNIGVTSTPVIDLSAGPHGTIFLVAMTQDSSSNYHQRLHALDLTTGNEQSGSPVAISATYTIPGTSTTDTFNPVQYKERAGLLLMNGTIYLSWASHCDVDPYQGWVMAYNETTLQQSAVLNIAPSGANARTAIWMANTAMAADTSGNIFFLAANGVFGDGSANPPLTNGFPSTPNYGNAFMKLSTTGNTLKVADYFAMFNAN